MPRRVVLLSIPQLRFRDLAPGGLSCLEALVRQGGAAEFRTPFPSLPAPAFASLITGLPADRHGIVGDAYFDRETQHVVARPFHDHHVTGTRLWQRFHTLRPGARTMAWFTPSLQGATVDLAAWVDPDQGLQTSPDNLHHRLLERFGDYPAPRNDPSGEPLRLAATAWILQSAAAVLAEHLPDLAIVRIPYLGQVARRHGPDSPEACRAVLQLERLLRPFLASLAGHFEVLAFTESVSTPVEEAVFPNLVLRGLGMLELEPTPAGGTRIDTRASAAFALADHQLCHIYVNDPSASATIASTFSGPEEDGVAIVASGRRRRRINLDHPRAGDIVLVARPAHYFSPEWWVLQTERPVNPGECHGLALGAFIPAQHIRGSLGAPPPTADYHGAIVSSRRALLPADATPVDALALGSLTLQAADITTP